MTSMTFDFRVRALTCPSCGAPLVTVREGGSIRCTYCSTTSVVTARKTAPRAGIRSSLAEETARLSRLKAQLEHPVAGHFYDLTRPPIGFESWTASDTNDVERLFREWSEAVHEPVGARAEMQRRVCWMALRGASVPRIVHDLRTRALLETTLGWLEDEGYRHLVRCRLAQSALDAQQLEAAEGWISECDWAPEVLELDSASRLIRAWLACRRRHADDVLEILGDEGAHLPIAAYQQNEAERLRVDAFEAQNRMDAAYRGFQSLVQLNGIDAETESFTRCGLAPQTVKWAQCNRLAEVTQQRIDRLRRKVADLAKRREQFTIFSATKPIMKLPVHAMLLSLAVLLVRCSYSVDPLRGSYGYVLCPKVCKDCLGPARTITEWIDSGPGERSTNGPQYFCQTPTHRVAEMSTVELLAQLRELSRQELGPFSAFFATYFVVLVGLLPVGLLQSIRRALRNKRQMDVVSRELQETAQRLGEPAPTAPSHLGSSILAVAFTFGLAGIAALVLALLTV